MPLSRIRCAILARIIGAIALATLLSACSAIQLAYNNLPEISYWWLDSYVDFDDAQTPRVRDELRRLLAWHRREELPKLVELLQEAQALAPSDLRPEQACALFDAARLRVQALAERAELAGTELALSLGEAQLEHLARKMADTNADFKKDWLARSRSQQLEKRYQQFLDRSEDFYGRLDAEQRELLHEQVALSGFDARTLDAERKARQHDLLALLRRFNAEKTRPQEARSAIRAYAMRMVEPPPGPENDRRLARQQATCRTLAALHNQTTSGQREKAQRRLRTYVSDLQELAASP